MQVLKNVLSHDGHWAALTALLMKDDLPGARAVLRLSEVSNSSNRDNGDSGMHISGDSASIKAPVVPYLTILKSAVQFEDRRSNHPAIDVVSRVFHPWVGAFKLPAEV